ncbi:ABC transporter substrate-binding protein [Paenibacillus psychroresistens]|uniref:ABC transporter substrate-binding protein n=1 Tax=Paenibacillus psychroresistens TaxID=1778678 RepID=UPI001391A88F|nr:extracellular solute-binding protein [Paenibacillus psychroresistens]
MKRSKWVSILLSLSIVAALAGCSKSTPEATDAPAAATAAPVATAAPDAATPAPDTATAAPVVEDITTKKIAISVYSPPLDNKEGLAAEKAKVVRFNEKYPNIKVTLDPYQYGPTTIAAKGAGGTLATVFQTYASEGKFLSDKGWAADISGLLAKYPFGTQFNANMLNQFKFGDKIYAIPKGGYIVGVGLNKKMLDAKGVAVPPMDWTWADMLATAKAVADPAKGIAGIAPMGKGTESGWNWTNFLYTAGGDIESVGADGKVTATFNSPEGVKALDFYKSLNAENVIPKNWATLGWGDAMGLFGQQRSAMVIGGLDGPADFALNQGGLKPADVLIYPIPVMNAGDKHLGVLGGDFYVFNAKATPDELEAAFLYETFDLFKPEGISSREKDIEARKATNKFFIPSPLEYFNPDSDYGKEMKAMYDKHDNVYQYSAELMSLAVGKPEAQFNGQDFYAEAAKAVQGVFKDKNADSKALLDSAAKALQVKLDAIK